MKKLILVITVVALLASCSKKHSDPKPTITPQTATANDFKGDWVLTVDSSLITKNGKTTITINISQDGANFEFNADGSTGYIGATGISNDNFTYTVAGGMLNLHIPATTSNAAQDPTFTIRLITTTELILRASDASEIDDLVLEKK